MQPVKKKKTKPTLGLDKKRSEKLNFWVTSAEKKQILRQAASLGFKKISPFLVAKTLSYTVSVRREDERKSDNLVYELNKIGVLLNQITRKINRYSLEQQQRILMNSEAETLKKLEELLSLHLPKLLK